MKHNVINALLNSIIMMNKAARRAKYDLFGVPDCMKYLREKFVGNWNMTHSNAIEYAIKPL